MRYLQISTVMSYGSIGRIMRQNYDKKKAEGWECLIAYGRGESVEGYNSIQIGTNLDIKMHGLETRLFDRHGYGSKRATRVFLEKAERFNPTIIHLHNIHGYYINFELLFQWIKEHTERTVLWTLHDCWAFTGHCSYFTFVDCDRWKTACKKCPQIGSYPASMSLDNCSNNFARKKKAFMGVKNLSIITPSQWLADLVAQSFLKGYPVEVKYNAVDNEIFKPTQGDFRKVHHIEDKKMILGVANVWEKRKGLNDFFKLRDLLGEEYVIVLVGLNKRQLASLPNGIIGIHRTNSAIELAEIYTTADVFVNPTYEDNYPTVNLEAEACGTKVITYDIGGCRETIKRADSKVISVGRIEEIYEEITRERKQDN